MGWLWIVAAVIAIPMVLMVGGRLELTRGRWLAAHGRLGPWSATQQEVALTLDRISSATGPWSGQEEAGAQVAYFKPILEAYREPLRAELAKRAQAGSWVAAEVARDLGLG